tara:strand:+ start:24464 stop:25465 length:1002 start_codon:yes stop_codon:yes gene_type:complete
MKDDYLFFIGCYESYSIEIETTVLNLFKTGIENGEIFDPSSRQAYIYLRANTENLTAIIEPYQDIFSKLINNEYNKGHEYKVINQKITPMLNKLKNNNNSLETFLDNSAKLLSFQDLLRDYSDYHDIYSLMFDANRFEGYKYLKKFKIIDSSKKLNEHPLYIELTELASGKDINILSEKIKINAHSKAYTTIPKYNLENIQVIINRNFYKLEHKQLSQLSNKGFFKYLIDDIIDNDYTTYLDYLKVICINPELHRSYIRFKGDNHLGCLLFKKLKITTSKKIAQYELLRSKKNVSLSETSISKALKETTKNTERNEELVNTILNLLSKIQSNR